MDHKIIEQAAVDRRKQSANNVAQSHPSPDERTLAFMNFLSSNLQMKTMHSAANIQPLGVEKFIKPEL